MVQWLGLCTSTAAGMGSIPGRGTRISHAARPKKIYIYIYYFILALLSLELWAHSKTSVVEIAPRDSDLTAPVIYQERSPFLGRRAALSQEGGKSPHFHLKTGSDALPDPTDPGHMYFGTSVCACTCKGYVCVCVRLYTPMPTMYTGMNAFIKFGGELERHWRHGICKKNK